MRDFLAFSGRRRAGSLLGWMVLASLLEGVSLALLVPLFALLTSDSGGKLQDYADTLFASFGANGMLEQVTLIVAGFVIAMSIRAIVLLVRDRSVARLRARYVEHRRLKVLETVASADWQAVAGLQHARVTNALTVEVSRIAGVAQASMQIVISLLMLVSLLALTIAISPTIGILAVVLLVAGGVLAMERLRIAEGYGETIGRGGTSIAHTAGQLLGGLKQAAAENRQSAFVRTFAKEGAALVAAQIAYQHQVTRFQAALSIGIALAGGMVLIGGTWLGTDSATLIATIVILTRIVGPAIGLQRDTEMFATMIPAHRMLEQLGTELRSEPAPARPSDEAPPGGTIVLSGVSFSHGADREAGDTDSGGGGVRNVSLAIAQGEVIGLCGPSGAGKTTLLDLTIGLIAPHSGSIAIGGRTLDPGLSAVWRDRVAYAAQDAFLTNDTIRANLTTGSADTVSDEALWHALALAQVDRVVRAMPEGLDTRMGERGNRLSGGERQRVAIARALLRRPALLVLDEASNAIDIATEDAVLANIVGSDPVMIVIVVAHRNEALRRCDRIVTLEAGRIVGDVAVAR